MFFVKKLSQCQLAIRKLFFTKMQRFPFVCVRLINMFLCDLFSVIAIVSSVLFLIVILTPDVKRINSEMAQDHHYHHHYPQAEKLDLRILIFKKIPKSGDLACVYLRSYIPKFGLVDFFRRPVYVQVSYIQMQICVF